MIQRNDAAGFVSSTDYASSFDALASVSSDIDPESLDSAMSDAGFAALGRCEYPLPNGKTLIRQDFRPTWSAEGIANDHRDYLHQVKTDGRKPFATIPTTAPSATTVINFPRGGASHG